VFEQITTIAVAIVGVAILAVIVSKRSATTNVINAAGGAFSSAVATAVSPITGGSAGYGGAGYGGGGFYNPGLNDYNSSGLYH
jgi:hypothetical protein